MPETRCTDCNVRLKTGAQSNVWWRKLMPAGTMLPICADCWSRGQIRQEEADAAAAEDSR